MKIGYARVSTVEQNEARQMEALREEGVDKIFAYPGGYDKDIFDALYHEKDIELILPRHE